MNEWLQNFIAQGGAFLASMGLSVGALLSILVKALIDKINNGKLIQRVAQKATDAVMSKVVPEVEKQISEGLTEIDKELDARFDAESISRKEAIEKTTTQINAYLDKLPEITEESVGEAIDELIA